jgi:hypothetical protein
MIAGSSILAKSFWLLCPPDKYVVEGHAACNDDERHGNAEPFIRQHEGEEKEKNDNILNRRKNQFIQI